VDEQSSASAYHSVGVPWEIQPEGGEGREG
jgi:hypothetical protein